MSEISAIVLALKAALREHGLLYCDVAQALGVSESTIKRAFASRSFHLDRLAQIADLMDLRIADLVQRAAEEGAGQDQLSEEQERALVADSKLLLLAFLLLNDWRLDDILADYAIDEHEAVRLLVRLDQLKIIDLQPGNRARVLVSRRFRWRERGPIQRFFEAHVQDEFFSSRFNRPLELRLVLTGMLGEGSIEALQQRFSRLAEEFESRAVEDRGVPMKRRLGTTAILAIRPWSVSVFDQYRREDAE